MGWVGVWVCGLDVSLRVGLCACVGVVFFFLLFHFLNSSGHGSLARGIHRLRESQKNQIFTKKSKIFSKNFRIFELFKFLKIFEI